jgi:hypothetical protein
VVAGRAPHSRSVADQLGGLDPQRLRLCTQVRQVGRDDEPPLRFIARPSPETPLRRFVPLERFEDHLPPRPPGSRGALVR